MLQIGNYDLACYDWQKMYEFGNMLYFHLPQFSFKQKVVAINPASNFCIIIAFSQPAIRKYAAVFDIFKDGKRCRKRNAVLGGHNGFSPRATVLQGNFFNGLLIYSFFIRLTGRVTMVSNNLESEPMPNSSLIPIALGVAYPNSSSSEFHISNSVPS